MIRALEFTPFLAVAVAVHVWALGTIPGGAVSSGGDNGDQLVNLTGADTNLQALVDDWVKPPVTAQPAPVMSAPPAPRAAPEPASALTTADLPAVPQPMPLAFGAAPQLPRMAQAPAPATPRPQARPQKPRAAQAPAQRAAGSGKAASAGQNGKAQDTARAGNEQAGLVAKWGGAIRTAVLRNQRQPAARISGTVHLRISVHTNGQLAGVAVRKSSGHAALDAAAVAAVQRARLPSAPKGLSGTQHFNLPVSFKG